MQYPSKKIVAIRTKRGEYTDHLFAYERQRRLVRDSRRLQIDGGIGVDPFSFFCEAHERAQSLKFL
jgi:hypothetical protein